jgi:phosphoglycerol transferase MdoB-like AlkP superfamily enzyme
MEEPEGYSEEAVRAIAAKYRERARIANHWRTNLRDLNLDVVYVMNESFSDPDRFSEPYPWDGPSTELMPELHRIQREAAHGWVYSPRYGGGTANIEYEALTGFSTYFTGWAYPYQSMLANMERFPSAARLFAAAGYQTVGLHPYGATMYRRSTVYPVMGFDEFHGADEFLNTAHDRGSYYISDESAYRETEAYLESGAGGKFITLITMQNHPQYGKQFKEHTFRSGAWDESYLGRQKINDYMELIHDSDAMTGDFLDWVAAREKPTVVVFWGDHLPGLYDRLFETDPALAYETPYFIYANFDAQTLGHGAGSAEDDLGEISPNFLSTDLFDYLDAQKPPWYYLLDAVKADAPIVTATYFDENGEPKNSEALADYRMIAYDMLKGEQYAEATGLFNIAANY